MGKKVVKICPKCGKKYFLGYTGVGEGCDKCIGITREADGTAWHPEEKEQTRLYFDGRVEVVKRPEGL